MLKAKTGRKMEISHLLKCGHCKPCLTHVQSHCDSWDDSWDTEVQGEVNWTCIRCAHKWIGFYGQQTSAGNAQTLLSLYFHGFFFPFLIRCKTCLEFLCLGYPMDCLPWRYLMKEGPLLQLQKDSGEEGLRKSFPSANLWCDVITKDSYT